MPQGKQTKVDRMERTLEVWLANPLDTFEQIAEKAGVSERTMYRYRSDPAFMAEYSRRQKERFASLEGKAVAQLERKLNEGEWKAIQYTLDGLGYKATEKVDVDTNANFVINILDTEE